MSAQRYVQKTGEAGIDWFRILAAVMVIAIHTGPFSKISSDMDYLITYCVGRVAVPFFLMTTGYFVLGPVLTGRTGGEQRVIRFLKKTLILYAISIFLYLPVNIYAGGMPRSAGKLLQMLLFDGTFYHLWYFPAVILGVVLVVGLFRKFQEKWVVLLVFLLYLIGVGGDSWFGAFDWIPGIKHLYGLIFSISGYTRNGIFFAPMYLMMGAMLRKREGYRREGRTAGFIISMALMLIEGYLSYRLDIQRHNSMYIFLIPVMYFLFSLLLKIQGKAPVWTRNISMIVYIIHPAVLIFLRGAAGAAGLTELLVGNTLIQFLSVTVLSFAALVFLHLLLSQLRKVRLFIQKGGA